MTRYPGAERGVGGRPVGAVSGRRGCDASRNPHKGVDFMSSTSADGDGRRAAETEEVDVSLTAAVLVGAVGAVEERVGDRDVRLARPRDAEVVEVVQPHPGQRDLRGVVEIDADPRGGAPVRAGLVLDNPSRAVSAIRCCDGQARRRPTHGAAAGAARVARDGESATRPRRVEDDPVARASRARSGADRSEREAGGDQAHNNMQPYLTLNFCLALPGVYPPRT